MSICDSCGDSVETIVVCATCPKSLCGLCTIGPDLQCRTCHRDPRTHPPERPVRLSRSEYDLYQALYQACRAWQRIDGGREDAALVTVWNATTAVKDYVDGPDDATPRSSGSDPVREWTTKNEWRWRR